MKIKTIAQAVGVLAITAMFASCSSSNQVTSSFSTRKYVKGYFLNMPGKAGDVASNKTTGNVNVATGSQKFSVAPAASQNANGVSDVVATDANVSNRDITTSNNQTLSNVVALAKSAKKVAIGSKIASNEVLTASNTETRISQSSPDAATSTKGGSCKSWVVCVILCFLLGEIGIHRFYMGYIWQGVVQLLTAGGCGIWTLIDWIRILMRNLKPKGGDYC